MSDHATPGVYYEAADAAAEAFLGVRTDIAGLCGVALRGPVGVPVPIVSWRQFETVFGGLHPDAFLGYAVQAFFANGGRRCHVVRVAAPEVVTVPRPGFPQPADGFSTVVDDGGGFSPGAVVDVVQEAPPLSLSRTIQAVDAAARRLVWDAPLPADVWLDQPLAIRGPGGVTALSDTTAVQPPDRGATVVRGVTGLVAGMAVSLTQPVRRRMVPRRLAGVSEGSSRLLWEDSLAPALDPSGALSLESGAAAGEAVFVDLDAQPLLRVAASSPGAWAGAVMVRLTTGVGASTRTAASPQPPDRRSSVVTSVSGFARGDLVRVTQAGALPPETHLVVAAVDAPGRRLVWEPERVRDRIEPWSGRLPGALAIELPMTFEKLELGLSVYVQNRLAEVFPGLSMCPASARYAPDLVNPASALVSLAPAWDTPPPDPRGLAPAGEAAWLVGGREGLAALTSADFTGPGGIPALAPVDEVAIVAAPDAFLRPGPPQLLLPTVPPPFDPCSPCPPPPADAPPPAPPPVELAPTFDDAAAFRIQAALVEQCERLRYRFAFLDSPRPAAAAEEGVAVAREWRRRFDSNFAALHFPWLNVRDPLRRGEPRAVPPSGHVLGLCARLDLADGVHRAPAGGELSDVQSLTLRLDDALHGLLNAEGVNAIRAQAGRGIRVVGARTVSSDSRWRFINVRRLVSMIEKTLAQGCQLAVFEPNDSRLRGTLVLGITELLLAIWQRGAMAGLHPEDAFYVRCDDGNNPPAQAARGELVVEVGVAPAAPAEFVVFRIGRVADQVEILEAGGTPASAGVSG